VFNAFGTKVTLIEALPRSCRSDAEVSDVLAKAFKKRHRRAVGARSRRRRRSRRRFDRGRIGRQEETLEVDCVLVARAAAPNSENLGLESAGIK